MADRALRRGDVTAAAWATAIEAGARCRGISRARLVLGLADGRRETPLESWSAWAFAVEGVPAPRWQVTLLDRDGVFLGRADAWWQEGLAGEADGRAKYRLAALERTGAIDAEGLAGALDDERRRERGFRGAGAAVVRWGPPDVLRSEPRRRLAAQLRRDLELVRGNGPFTGTALEL